MTAKRSLPSLRGIRRCRNDEAEALRPQQFRDRQLSPMGKTPITRFSNGFQGVESVSSVRNQIVLPQLRTRCRWCLVAGLPKRITFGACRGATRRARANSGVSLCSFALVNDRLLSRRYIKSMGSWMVPVKGLRLRRCDQARPQASSNDLPIHQCRSPIRYRCAVR